MKTLSLSAITAAALTSSLMADEVQAQVDVVEIIPQIEICREAPSTTAKVKELKDMEANEEAIDSILQNEEAKTALDKLNAPILLKSMEDALKHLTRDSMEKITDAVDFETQQLAIFAWQGSGQDRLTGMLAAGDGAATRFHYTPGMTKDLKRHSAVYVMPKDTNLAVVKMERQIIRCGVRGGAELKVEPLMQNGNQFKFELKVQPAQEAE